MASISSRHIRRRAIWHRAEMLASQTNLETSRHELVSVYLSLLDASTGLEFSRILYSRAVVHHVSVAFGSQ